MLLTVMSQMLWNLFTCIVHSFRVQRLLLGLKLIIKYLPYVYCYCYMHVNIRFVQPAKYRVEDHLRGHTAWTTRATHHTLSVGSASPRLGPTSSHLTLHCAWPRPLKPLQLKRYSSHNFKNIDQTTRYFTNMAFSCSCSIKCKYKRVN